MTPLPSFLPTYQLCLYALQDNVPAALSMQIAHELAPGSDSYTEDLERLMRRVPLPVADALEVWLRVSQHVSFQIDFGPLDLNRCLSAHAKC